MNRSVVSQRRSLIRVKPVFLIYYTAWRYSKHFHWLTWSIYSFMCIFWLLRNPKMAQTLNEKWSRCLMTPDVYDQSVSMLACSGVTSNSHRGAQIKETLLQIYKWGTCSLLSFFFFTLYLFFWRNLKQITITYNDNWMGLRFRFQLGSIWHSKPTDHWNTLGERRSNMVQLTVFQRSCLRRHLGNGRYVWLLCVHNCKKDLLGIISTKQAKQISVMESPCI